MNSEDKRTLALVLATIAGFIMVATGIFFATANNAIINNNNIGIEIAKSSLINNVSLYDYPELNNLIKINNEIARR